MTSMEYKANYLKHGINCNLVFFSLANKPFPNTWSNKKTIIWNETNTNNAIAALIKYNL